MLDNITSRLRLGVGQWAKECIYGKCLFLGEFHLKKKQSLIEGFKTTENREITENLFLKHQ